MALNAAIDLIQWDRLFKLILFTIFIMVIIIRAVVTRFQTGDLMVTAVPSGRRTKDE